MVGQECVTDGVRVRQQYVSSCALYRRVKSSRAGPPHSWPRGYNSPVTGVPRRRLRDTAYGGLFFPRSLPHSCWVAIRSPLWDLLTLRPRRPQTTLASPVAELPPRSGPTPRGRWTRTCTWSIFVALWYHNQTRAHCHRPTAWVADTSTAHL